MVHKLLLMAAVIALSGPPIVAQQAITLENIWQDYTFTARHLPGFSFLNDGKHYTRMEQDKVQQYDITTGKFTKTLFDAATHAGNAGFEGDMDGYTFSDDEQKMIITTNKEPLYRHSYKADFYVWDGEALSKLFEGGKQMYATFNPQADKVAFVFENNLYVKDLASQKLDTITTDGEINKIINGATDWVYEEEFAFDRAFQWSSDGEKIAYYRFDESAVPEFTMTNYHKELYPEYVTFKYPKVGEQNATVRIFIYHIEDGKKVEAAIEPHPDQYIPRIKWTTDPDQLAIFKLNRHQNDLRIVLANASDGSVKELLHETSKWYISEKIYDNLTFLKDGKRLLWTSERDGWHHIYLYNMEGGLIRQLTRGDWEVTSLYGVDEENDRIYFQAAKVSPMEREIYSTQMNGNNTEQLTSRKGWNNAQFSSTFDYFVNTFSTINSPPEYSVMDRMGERIRIIEDNDKLRGLQRTFNTQPVQFFDFKTKDEVRLNGWMIKPPDFDETKEYPVFMYLYGGPGSQQVIDRWKGQNYWWFQMLAQQGYIVACVDNRGTGGRGAAFKKITYLQLGHYETIDQIEAAKYLGSLPYTDANRIGIFGWSYGGYMASLALLKGNDVFKAAIAVAPVTNWKWYDTIYTERFMRTAQENQSGYEQNSPINFADRLRGNYLLIHGMSDDNVHFQHTAEMVNALIAANKQFETYFYPNRNHSIYGGPTRLHLYTKMTNFLNDQLMNDTTPVQPESKRP